MQSYKQFQLTWYHFSIGWPSFRRSNNISKGDECVFKYIRCEDKMCLVKVTKRKTQARSSPPAAVAIETEVDDGLDDKDAEDNNDKDEDEDEDEDADFDDDDDPFFVVTLTQYNFKGCLLQRSQSFRQQKLMVMWILNSGRVDKEAVKFGMDDKEADKVVELADGVDDSDPFFVVTITTIHKSMLRLPSAFVGLSRIDAKENIILKRLDGNERLMALRSYQQNNSTYYCLSMGWPAFMRSNSISEGDECVFKYITSEGKMCLAKVTQTKTKTRLSSPAKVVKKKRGRPAKVVKRKRGRPAKISMAENVKITVEEVVKRKRGRPPASPRATEDIKRKKGWEPCGHSADVEGVDKCVGVGKRPRGRPAKRLC
ncbi:DNA-binding pseudobarrel domain-containing protein [Tanacetum coccineum]|uniref:DNA-binding pseudobarrel domain-containing protein n=1 Tax=Tanacetum coccineum TaxID=301880 RepID=A0ABQ5CFP8_9ASTR